MHYYAVHPMSNYGHGQVSCDFCGLARNIRQSEQPDVFQIYFNGCAGTPPVNTTTDQRKRETFSMIAFMTVWRLPESDTKTNL